ncbi:MAG: zinc ribbon domain-containing protein [Planctomycetes bacterium]|nr:zinc ribbon domain-containing protein [Planctomycetota bacterium]
MPIYEFHCDDCGADFEELFRSVRERRRPSCDKCGSGNVHKKFSTFATSSADGRSASGGGCGSCTRSSCTGCGG